MTPQRAKELLPIINAFAEGKQVQFKHKTASVWADVLVVSWSEDCDYRIKPEPREWFRCVVCGRTKERHLGEKSWVCTGEPGLGLNGLQHLGAITFMVVTEVLKEDK